MTLRVRVLVPARNEQHALGPMLSSVRTALSFAMAAGADWDASVTVVLDRCDDESRIVAERAHVQVLDCPAPHGKVEALRVGFLLPADVYVSIDADVLIGPRTLLDLVSALRADERLLATCPPLAPLPSPQRATLLSWALFRYNAARGFSSERLWLSGRCYAVRQVCFPKHDELLARAAALPTLARRAELAAPLQADDVWLSRYLLSVRNDCIRHIITDPVLYRPVRTLSGMSRTYRRLRRELRRIDLLFPELPGPGRDRRVDNLHGLRDRLALAIFQAALWLCRRHAAWEDIKSFLWSHAPDVWPVVTESKR